MAASVSGRDLVLEALLMITRDGEYSHIVLKNILDTHQYLDKKRACVYHESGKWHA